MVMVFSVFFLNLGPKLFIFLYLIETPFLYLFELFFKALDDDFALLEFLIFSH
jgi:hypothetical protein